MLLLTAIPLTAQDEPLALALCGGKQLLHGNVPRPAQIASVRGRALLQHVESHNILRKTPAVNLSGVHSDKHTLNLRHVRYMRPIVVTLHLCRCVGVPDVGEQDVQVGEPVVQRQGAHDADVDRIVALEVAVPVVLRAGDGLCMVCVSLAVCGLPFRIQVDCKQSVSKKDG